MSGEGDENLEENEALAQGRPKRDRKPVDYYKPEDIQKKRPLHTPEVN